MKSLQEYLMESMMINERLMDGWFDAFEFKSQEKFKPAKARTKDTFFEYLDPIYPKSLPKEDQECGNQIDFKKLPNDKKWEYMGKQIGELRYNTWSETIELHPSNGNLRYVMAMGKDGKMYSNDPEFMKELGLTPKPNKKFDKKNFDDKFTGNPIGFYLVIPGYDK